jgi:20S proteasome subunit beta 7
VEHSVQDYASYLASLGYERRNKQNPYYNNFVVAGYEDGKAHLSSIDMYGTHIKKDFITAGFAKYFGLASIATLWNPELSLEECKKIIHLCFMVIYERDCHSVDQVQFTTVTEKGVEIFAPEQVESRNDFREFRERKNEKLWQ